MACFSSAPDTASCSYWAMGSWYTHIYTRKGLETRGVLWPPSHTINTHKAVNSLIRGHAQQLKWLMKTGTFANGCYLMENYLNDTDGQLQDRVFLFTLDDI